MRHEHGAYRRPYRRGDYRLVDTTREGTYWRSADGVDVRMASGEGEPLPLRRVALAWGSPLWLFARTAGQ